MTRIEKLIDRFLENPESVKYSELEKILLYFGFEIVQAKGSHIKIKNIPPRKGFSIPIHNNDCKSFYKKKAANLIKEIFY